MYDYKTGKDIVYLNFNTSSYETGDFENSSKPDSLCTIMKNNILILIEEDNIIEENLINDKPRYY